MKHVRHTFLFMLVWAILLNGCSSWRMSSQPPPDETSPTDVRVTLKDGNIVEVKEAYAMGDTLYGSGPMSGYYWDDARAIPLENITKIEQRKLEPGKTGLAVLGGVVIVGGVALVILIASDSSWFGDDSP